MQAYPIHLGHNHLALEECEYIIADRIITTKVTSCLCLFCKNIDGKIIGIHLVKIDAKGVTGESEDIFRQVEAILAQHNAVLDTGWTVGCTDAWSVDAKARFWKIFQDAEGERQKTICGTKIVAYCNQADNIVIDSCPDHEASDAYCSGSKKIASNLFTFTELIAMPVKSIIDANAYGAKVAIDLIKEYGFEKHGKQGYRLRMFEFSYQSTTPKGEQRTVKIAIPALSLIPLPLLEIKKARFEFSLDILDQIEQVKNHETVRSTLAILSDHSITEHESQSVKHKTRSNMKVSIEIGQSDLPAGIIQLSNLLREAQELQTT